MSLLVSGCWVVTDDDVADALTGDVTRGPLLEAGAIVVVLAWEEISVRLFRKE